jgi:hypothetical protein
MNARILCAASLLVGAASLPGHAASAQAPCSTSPAVIDSARDDVMSILESESPLALELKQEQHLAGRITISEVRDARRCTRMAAALNHSLPAGTTFAVLHVGPIYYARDPDQRRATGVFTDSTFHVLIRLGAAMPDSSTSGRVR